MRGARIGCWAVSVSLLSPVAAAAPSWRNNPRGYDADDPLADPQWHSRERRYQIATGVFAGLGAGALISFIAVNAAHPHALCEDCFDDGSEAYARGVARDRAYDRAIVGLGVAAGVSMLGLVIAGTGWDLHRERAVRYAPILRRQDVRNAAWWQRRELRLTRGMRATAALAGIFGISSMIVWPYHAEAHTGGPAAIGASLSALGGVSLIAFVALAAARWRDGVRAKITLSAGGLTVRF